MAQQQTAQVVAARALGPHTRLLELALPEGQSLGFTGGQYIIVNTGLTLPDGKTVKRAYSLVSSDTDQGRFALTVRRVGAGPGSNFMQDVPVGTPLGFSGPWGKWHSPAPESGPLRVVVTDTGITAALGLLRSAGFQPQLPQTTVLWLTESPDYFLPTGALRDWIPAGCREVSQQTLPPIGDPRRADAGRALVREAFRSGAAASVYLAGDGRVLIPIRDELIAGGMSEERIRVECFFNNPAKKS